MTVKINRPRGTQDFYAEQASSFRYFVQELQQIAEAQGFKPIWTPIFEMRRLFKENIGSTSDIVQKEMFSFTDRKNRILALRPEGTAGICRAMVENKIFEQINQPWQFYYYGPMFRYERPQAGRYREFWQFGVEFFGVNSAYRDFAILNLASAMLHRFNITNYKCRINFLVNGEARAKYITALKQALSQLKLCYDCQRRLIKNPLRVLDCKIDVNQFANIPIMKDYLSPESLDYANALTSYLQQHNFNYIIDDRLVRGLDYYQGLVFEFSVNNQHLADATVIAGGHFQGIVERLGHKDIPGIGFAAGIERLKIASNIEDAVHTKKIITIATTNQKPELMVYAENIAKKLRHNVAIASIIVDYTTSSLTSKLKNYAKIQACWGLIIVGDAELAQQQVTLKIMATKQNVTMPLATITHFIAKKIQEDSA